MDICHCVQRAALLSRVRWCGCTAAEGAEDDEEESKEEEEKPKATRK